MTITHIWDILKSDPKRPRTMCGLLTGGRIRAELPIRSNCKRCKSAFQARVRVLRCHNDPCPNERAAGSDYCADCGKSGGPPTP